MKKIISEILEKIRMLKEKNKSSIYHFSKYYPEDENLKKWCEILNI